MSHVEKYTATKDSRFIVYNGQMGKERIPHGSRPNGPKVWSLFSLSYILCSLCKASKTMYWQLRSGRKIVPLWQFSQRHTNL